jgi:hypothetical protein
MQHRMTVAQVGIERRQRREFTPDGVVGEALLCELLPPGDDVGAGRVAELFRSAQAGEGLKVGDISLVGAAGMQVGEIGKPLECDQNLWTAG